MSRRSLKSAPIIPRLPTLKERDRIVEALLTMRRAGQLGGVWAPTHLGVPIRPKDLHTGPPWLLPWREAGALTGVTIERKAPAGRPTLVKRKRRA
jgi:hypothetical protein